MNPREAGKPIESPREVESTASEVFALYPWANGCVAVVMRGDRLPRAIRASRPFDARARAFTEGTELPPIRMIDDVTLWRRRVAFDSPMLDRSLVTIYVSDEDIPRLQGMIGAADEAIAFALMLGRAHRSIR